MTPETFTYYTYYGRHEVSISEGGEVDVAPLPPGNGVFAWPGPTQYVGDVHYSDPNPRAFFAEVAGGHTVERDFPDARSAARFLVDDYLETRAAA